MENEKVTTPTTVTTPEIQDSSSSKKRDTDDESSIVSGSKMSELSLPVQDGTYLSRNLFKSAVSPPKKRDSETWPFNSNRFIEGIEPPCVKISLDGFEPENISIMEGQTVTFLWEEYNEKLSFYQVVHDGEMPIPVRGGYSFMIPQEQSSRQLFNMRAEYKFMLLDVKGPILTINVHERIDLEAHITNTGFQPEVIYITKGHSIIWKWDGNAIRHTVQEMVFCQRHARFMAKSPEPTVGTLKGTHRQQFRRPGIYYFRTESSVLNKFHYCAVIVTETCREHKIEVLDEAFQPMILVIEEGETVWWQWNRAMCKRCHAIYQIKPPDLKSYPDDPFEPVENGFAWLVPSIQGLMAHRFTEPGTYYFSDQNHEFSATFMGTIIVKSKPKEHFLEVNAQTGFSNDLIHAKTNDRIWWIWKEKDRKDGKVSTINEADRTINPLAKNISCSCEAKAADNLEEEEIAILKTLGISVVTLSTVGVYTYTVSCVQDIVSTCSVIVQASSKNHTVHITEDGFEKHYLTIRANDCVGWVWQNEKHPHNIIQVTYENEIVTDGFCSGNVRDSPSAFMHQFTTPGVYYYKSNSLKKIGTIVVESKTQVQKVDVSIMEIKPDPIMVNVNDILCWVFRGQRRYDVYEVNFQKKMISSLDSKNEELTPRRCVAKAIHKSGLIHFASKSFLKQKGDKDSEIRLSSVIADIVEDGILIHVDKNGFYPSNIVIEKGQCIMWKWTEAHNIVHVNYSNDTEISGVINGKNSFTSGKPVCNSQYTYSFYCEGDFTVVSQCALGYSCHIKVMKNAPKMAAPRLKEDNGQEYKQHKILWLECLMENSKESNVKIYFTFDGSYPHCYHDSTLVYNQNEGILLEKTGPNIIRAVATCPGFVDSEVFNSRRINVLASSNRNASQDSFQEKHSFESIENGPSEEVWRWWSCKPSMKIKKLEPGEILVTWELRDISTTHLIDGYKLYINDIAYNKMCHPSTNRLTVKGLAGGREYKFYLLAFSTLINMKPVQSNTVTIICPTTALSGGPLISLEWSDDSKSLSIVWIPSEEFPVVDYWVYRDGIKCGKKMTQSEKDQCRIILENWTTNLLSKVYIEAIPQVWNDMSFDPVQETRKSNVLEVKLPLFTNDFELSPLAKGSYPKGNYMEYITVIDDSAFTSHDKKKMEEKEKEKEMEETEEETEEEIDGTEEETEEEEIDETEETSEDESSDASETAENCIVLHIDDDSDTDEALHLVWDKPASLGDEPISYSVKLSGMNFMPNVNSNKRRESKIKMGVKKMYHYWNVYDVTECLIRGVIPNNTYRIKVKAKQTTNSKAKRLLCKSPFTEYTVKPTKSFPNYRQLSPTEMTDLSILLHIEDESEENVLHLSWKESSPLAPAFEIENYTVNVEGTDFDLNVNSNKSCECNIKGGETQTIRGLQHCWDTYKVNKCSIQGLKPSATYSISVVGTYKCPSNLNAEKMICKSSVIEHTVKGPPAPPKLNSFEVDLYQQLSPTEMTDLSILLHIEDESEENVLHLSWKESSPLAPAFEIENYTVNVEGTDFDLNVNSNKSYECNIKGGETQTIRGLQHCWDTYKVNKCSIQGLKPSATYSISVVGTYKCPSNLNAEKMICKSSVIEHTVKGPPGPPKLNSFEVDLYQVAFCIEPPEYLHHNMKLKGFKLYIDSIYTGKFYKFPAEKIVEKIEPGCTVTLTAVAVADGNVNESKHSSPVQVTCPHKPAAPIIKEELSYKKGCVVLAWNKPSNSFEQNIISSYRVFLDDELHGEICTNNHYNKNGYQFILTELSLHHSYKVFVKSVCGQKHTDLGSSHVCLMSDSVPSNMLWIRAPTDPKSPKLFIKKMSPDGIDIGWVSQQNAENSIAGYQILKNDEAYGAMIPVDVTELQIHDVNIGDQLTLQVIALKICQEVKDNQYGNSEERLKTGTAGMEMYKNSVVGAPLSVHFTDLPQPPSKVWCEKVTGHSALIVWKKEEKLKEHFIEPETYIVSWWPSNKSNGNYNSDNTTDDHFVLLGLRYDTSYTVVVEGKALKKYNDMDCEEKCLKEYYKNQTFPLISKAQPIMVKTAKPPDPPSALGMIASTCCSAKISWNSPKEHGVEITSLYLHCWRKVGDGDQLQAEDQQFLCVRPDVKEAVFDNLSEKTHYLVRIFAVTDEYFDWLPESHKLKKLRYIPEGMQIQPSESIWLPFSTFTFQTSGTDPATHLQALNLSFTSLTLTWVNAIVHGSNEALKILVHWIKDDGNKVSEENELVVGQHKVLSSDADSLTINNLLQGTRYSFTVVTVVSLRTSLDLEAKNNFRTVDVASKKLYATTRASVEQPKLFVKRYDRSTVVLSWKTPSLTTVLGHDKSGKILYLMCHLLGYQMKINDKLHAQLWPNDTSCTLQKCKQGKKYTVQLVAMSSIQEKKKLQKWELDSKISSEDLQFGLNSQHSEIDQTLSEPLEILLPTEKNGNVYHLDIEFETNEEEGDFGFLIVEWSVKNNTDLIKQFNVTWCAQWDQVVNTHVVKPNIYHCRLPVDKPKCLYEVNVQVVFNSGEVTLSQPVHVITPGAPDPPEIVLKSVDSMKFEIGWQEPRTYENVKIRAYEVHVNNAVIAEVQSDQFNYTYNCQPNCVYKVNVVALGTNLKFGNSQKSNTLVVSTFLIGSNLISKMSDCHNFKNFLQATKVSDTCISLDWSSYIPPNNIGAYKIQWNSVAQPKDKEIVQSVSNQQCIITKCLPGVIHYLQLIVIDVDGHVIEKSNYLTVQTAASPDIPVLNVSDCDFHCISVQWSKPLEYGDAIINKYKVIVNDEIVSEQSADQTSFTFTKGVPFTDYTFQVKALTTYNNLQSKISEPITITWPGVKPPSLKTDCFFPNSIKVTWDHLYVTESVKIEYFKVECFDAETGRIVDEIDLLPPDSREASFHGLKLGKYSIIQKIYLNVHGASKVVSSEAVEVQVAASIPAPSITVNIQGLEKWKKLVSMTCHLINTRDRLVRKSFLQNKTGKKSLDSSVLHIENNLQQFIGELSLNTGKVHLEINWECIQPEDESIYTVEGYQIFVDGKLLETINDALCTKWHIMIKADGRIHQVSMKTLTQHSSATRDESNVVDVETLAFLPFTFYCNSTVHRKNKSWPNYGCCQFVDSYNLEKRQRKQLLNPGLLPQLQPLPECNLMNLLSDKMESLLTLAASNSPLLILIWTPWCIPSRCTMKMFLEFAEKNEGLFSYMSVCCDEDSTDKAFLTKFLDESRWKNNKLVKHFSNIINTEAEKRNSLSTDFRKLLGIEEVPTLLIADSDGNLQWQGRYCVPHYKIFASFLHHTLHEIFARKNKNCNYCKVENDPEFVNQLLQESSQFLGIFPFTTRSKKMLSQRKANNSTSLQTSFNDSMNVQEETMLDLQTENPQEVWGSGWKNRRKKKRRRQQLIGNKSKI